GDKAALLKIQVQAPSEQSIGDSGEEKLPQSTRKKPREESRLKRVS
ncbi:hypothetical protein NFI96_027060, partial [Prochilodus magdalenae]